MNVTTEKLTEAKTDHCDAKTKYFVKKSDIILKNCDTNFREQISTLKNIIPLSGQGLKIEWNERNVNTVEPDIESIRARRMAEVLPHLFPALGSLLVNINTNKKVSKLTTEFEDFRSWNDLKISNINKKIVSLASLTQKNFEHFDNLLSGICESVNQNNDMFLAQTLSDNFDEYYENLMSDILTFSNHEIPLKSKFYNYLVEMCKNFQNSELDKETKTRVCNKILRSPQFSLNFAGLEITGENNIPSISINLVLKVPIVNIKYLEYKSFRVINSGYFVNQTNYQLDLPERFITKIIKNGQNQTFRDVISISNACEGATCSIQDLVFNQKSKCISNILRNQKLRACNKIVRPHLRCNVKYTENGILVTAEKALIVYHTKNTDQIFYGSRLLNGTGSVVCSDNNLTKTYRFDTSLETLNSYISLKKIIVSDLIVINKTKTSFDQININQIAIENSHIKINDSVYLGYDTIFFVGSTIISIMFSLLIRKYKQYIVLSLKNICTTFCSFKWCHSKVKSNTREPVKPPRVLYSVANPEVICSVDPKNIHRLSNV